MFYSVGGPYQRCSCGCGTENLLSEIQKFTRKTENETFFDISIVFSEHCLTLNTFELWYLLTIFFFIHDGFILAF